MFSKSHLFFLSPLFYIKMKIVINKGKCKIVPNPPSPVASVIDKHLSYEKQGARFMPNPRWGMVHLYNERSATFPAGYLEDVKDIIKQYYEYKKVDEDIEVVNENHHSNVEKCYTPPKTTLRDYQLEAVETFLNHKRGILALATGLGKTLTAVHLIHRLGVRALIITHTTELLKQWVNVIDRELGFKSGIYNGTKKELKDITVASIQTLHKFKHILKNFDFIIYDECHHISADMMYKTGLDLTQEYVLGLSATPYRSDNNDMKIKAIGGEIIYRKNIRWGIDNGYLCPAEVKWIKVDDDIEIDRYDVYAQVYNKKIVYNDKRNAEIVKQALSYDGKILILVSRIEHGEAILNLLEGHDVVFLQGNTKDKQTTSKIIIATTIFDEGIDLPDREIIILAGGGKSSVTTVQRIGRVLRLFPGKEKAIIIDFIEDCKYLKNHYKERKKIYEIELE